PQAPPASPPVRKATVPWRRWAAAALLLLGLGLGTALSPPPTFRPGRGGPALTFNLTRPRQGDSFVNQMPAIALAVLSALPAQHARPDTGSGGVALIAPAPVARRVALADVVVVGKVVGIEEKTVAAPRFPGDPNTVDYKIAVVKVEDSALNPKGVTHVRVGFL